MVSWQKLFRVQGLRFREQGLGLTSRAAIIQVSVTAHNSSNPYNNRVPFLVVSRTPIRTLNPCRTHNPKTLKPYTLHLSPKTQNPKT